MPTSTDRVESATAEARAEPQSVEPLSSEREVAILADLATVAAARAAAEKRTAGDLAVGLADADRDFEQARARLDGKLLTEMQAVGDEHKRVVRDIQQKHQREHSVTEQAHDLVRQQAAADYDAHWKRAKQTLDEASFEAKTVYDSIKDAPGKQFEDFRAQVDAGLLALRGMQEQAHGLLLKWRQRRIAATTIESETPGREAEPLAALQECIRTGEAFYTPLVRLRTPPLFQGLGIVWLFILLWMLLVVPAWIVTGGPHGLWVSLVASLLLGGLITAWLYSLARAGVRRLYPPLCQAVFDADLAHRRSVAEAEAVCRRQQAENTDRRDRALRAADEVFRARLEEAAATRDRELAEAESIYPRRLVELAQQRDNQLHAAEEARSRRTTQVQQEYETEWNETQERHRRRKAEVHQIHDAAWQAMADAWMNGLTRVHSAVHDVGQRARAICPDWKNLAEKGWPPVTQTPPALRIGQFGVKLAEIPEGVPEDGGLAIVAPSGYTFPGVVPFPAGCSMMFKARGSGRQPAVDALQNVMLRLLTSVPPGKVRFTIIDPVGLGENFSAFMHLADHDEALVNSRIWTDPRHIEQRLADLSEHMENVIQKYLRNEFPTIEEYNRFAGEIAEPFRFLVAANFPAGFSDAAARRLTSIAASGPRCGVYTLLTVDMAEKMPEGFELREVEKQSTVFVWKKDRFLWRNRGLDQYPLTLDQPPPAEQMTAILHAVGRQAKEASRVEVPFEFIAPPWDACWQGSTAKGIDVPLGRAGATHLQHLKLGHGTSQHVLVAGKTGSGKSTLLHALITNAALRYSPDELELYLVDFKKGVEFKTYATHRLPHGRVVAIESDREFGLSVLERLDVELKLRADKYRDLGVQDVAGYRKAAPDSPLPRIMLIVDEFQELFIEDDRVAQDGSLLLDRLVRQGRAFGIHVLLGSQTLGGAYSLARSTIGQMAVRIALQCSEADAHLILSEDNAAARLLSRAGEAIYNDLNGLIEGNHPFQVVWLPDEVREEHLKHVQQLEQASGAAPRPQVVFEGNIPADPARNAPLAGLLTGALRPVSAEADDAWLGEAVAIKDPTSAAFRPQSGGNLLIIGQHDDSALALMTMALVGLAAHRPHRRTNGSNDAARFYVFDGSSAGSTQAAALARLADISPDAVRIVPWRELAPAVAELAAEVERRQATGVSDHPPIYALIYGLQRFRDLRKEEDDFSFSRSGEEKPASPSKQYGTILREGPPVRVHSLVWCDSLNNLNRSYDRQTLREFDMRVLFQMSGNDSSTLIDGPAAAKLGLNRALFHSEEEGRFEKFRPYGLPSDEWLAWVRECLAGATAIEGGVQ
jgi:S-DNA-T family DNA segregation ATPase FtsK/SpoIIIE